MCFVLVFVVGTVFMLFGLHDMFLHLEIFVLSVAYKIGRIVLRIAAGLAFMAIFAALIWYIFLR